MRDPAPWQKKYALMLVYACLFGIFFQYLFVGSPAGVSVLLTVAGFYGLYFYSIRGRLGGFEPWAGQSTAGWLLLVPVFLLALTYTLFDNNLFSVLNAIALPLCIVMQTIVLSRNSKHAWFHATFLEDMVRHVIGRPIAHLPVPFGLIRTWLPSRDSGQSGTWGHAVKIAAGLLLAAPILMIVIGLLASADRIFSSWVSEISAWFSGISAGDSIGRIVLAFVVALYTFCYMWGLLFQKEAQAAHPFDSPLQEKPATAGERTKVRIDPITAGTLLVCVNSVYVLFVTIQFSYLFGAADGLLPEGVAYAEYARRGFAELVVVALINVALLFPGLHGIRRSGRGGEAFRKTLLTLLVTCTIVMLISAYSRLSLYEEAYGFTQSRVLVHGFMIFLGILFIIALFRIWLEKLSMSRAYITTAIIAYLVMNYMNIDHWIAVNNMERYEKTGKIDLAYLGRLSTDVVPALRDFQAKHPELTAIPSSIDQVIGSGGERSWPSWNLSRHVAEKK
ncbi:DUF4173 domain-containing protein [Bacillus sp. 3255]|uniref:DUF4153 domain-containing protein n=1 Tax=Bacillus sp. 3255 TaxID=2817904 RepID=UPI00285BD001|nr:DUF4173 domain-containing protein [Bacillus sp. 3255]MDR6884227.1 hypothetical protein [Bacillus sp. 3255]